MTVLTEFNERSFIESEWFQPIERQFARISSNNSWLNTAEVGYELDRKTQEYHKIIVRIVRWRARNSENDGRKVWRYSTGYSVRSPEEWETESQLINSFVSNNFQPIGSISMPSKEIERLYSSEHELQLFKDKVSKMQKRMKELESTLIEYNNLIKKDQTTETEVHNFLIGHKAFWMFGLEYNDIKSHVDFPPNKNYYEFDLMLRRFDDFWDLVELKGPNENLFDKRTSRRNKPNTALSEAVGQAITYLNSIDEAHELDIVKPKAYVVIGKTGTDRPIERRIFSSYLNNIDLITHSELYARGQRLLKHIKRVKTGKHL
jgi:hypothetical protein